MPSPAPEPEAAVVLRQGMALGVLVVFEYAGLERVVEPHVLGTRGGELYVLAYQVGGRTRSGEVPRWGRFAVGRALAARLTTVGFPVDRATPAARRGFDAVVAVARP